MSFLLQKRCFVVMPFRPDLHYLYLYLRVHLESKHGLRVERGDNDVLTKPLLEKIRQQILEADIVLGDITGRNPNVFYELGMADSYGKAVILMTQDDAAEVPTDVRHLEFIKYRLDEHEPLLTRLDNAVHNIFRERYEPLFAKAVQYLGRFNAEMSRSLRPATKEQFTIRVVRVERTQEIPAENDECGLAEFLLPKIIQDVDEVSVLKAVSDWLDNLPTAQPPRRVDHRRRRPK